MRTSSRFIPILLVCVLSIAFAGCSRAVSETIDDATITTRVKTAFINDPLVGGLRIDVDTVKGVVTLSGRVKSGEEEAKAVALAKSVRGVVDVKSTLQIEQQPAFTNPRS